MVAESGDDSEVGGMHPLSGSNYGSDDQGKSMHKHMAHTCRSGFVRVQQT